MSLLSIDSLGIAIGGRPLVEGVTLDIAAGERFGIIGESGSGKTLTALAITGLLPEGASVSGSLVFEGAPLPRDEAAMARLRGRRIAMVFQEPMTALNPLMTAGDQILEAARLAERPTDGARLTALLAEVGLEARHATRYPHQLSGGQRQRVMIAMALAGDPALLIADEPTSALDLITQRKVIDLVAAASARRGMALLLISHDLKAVAALCDRVAVIKAGRIVETGPTREVLGAPKSDYARLLVAASRPPPAPASVARAPRGEPLLVVDAVSRRYRQPGALLFRTPSLVALDAVSLTVAAGEAVALVGPSGCGKSTLARIVAGLDTASSGSLRFAGQPYSGGNLPKALRRDISLVFQDPFGSFDPRLPIGVSLTEPLRLEPETPQAEKSSRLGQMVEAVGLPADSLSRYPHEFSGGQRQRLAIARALITRPRLVVLDEPVSALDLSVRADILALLAELRAAFGLAYLVISHDLDMVAAIADRVLVMEAGHIVEEGTPQALFAAPRHAMTKALLAARLPDIG
ncbi:peptide/nickel transport system ATP-binding protein [Devosia enhydra]|uniref:Peptide/nickel transport system ATP-binding protein n=1 Tax=Devosia enhydra TaxID=665118 RepID=A0A1K2I1H1_9HYPH|nr:ABC transporter ATP-binding protein [Devosia enhydra]SFZ86176.1 peptide/nickel transport system ATP-binding protein [Devosia enhydra]